MLEYQFDIRVQDFIIVERKLRDVMATEITNRNRFQGRAPLR
jgi:hypothetical protein